MKALLVAEQSVLPLLDRVICGLFTWEIVDEAIIVVPKRQIASFAHLRGARVQVLAEDEILGPYTIDYIADRLGAYRYRAGWYLQQFVKLGFARHSANEQYVIWDADTIPLQPLAIVRDGRAAMNRSREFHWPYFQVFETLLELKPVLKFSVISQYMAITTRFALEMLHRIQQLHGMDWVDATLAALPLNGQSEFSEYETYGNYMASQHPGQLEFVRRPWFRHGSDILSLDDLPSYREIEHVFTGYSYVSFERRRHTGLKRRLIGAQLKLKLSS